MAPSTAQYRRRWCVLVALLPLMAAPGCDSDIVKRACMTVGGPGPLVSGANAFRLDVYDGDASCAGTSIAPGAGLPSLTRTYTRDQAIELQVGPGNHALVLTTYADAGATQPLGAGCLVTKATPGAQLCFDLTVAALSDLGGIDGGGGMDAGSDGGQVVASKCSGSTGFILCDGFEDGQLDARWTRYIDRGSAEVDATRAYRGTGSLLVHLDSATGTAGHGTVYTPLAYPYPDLYVRAFVFVPALTSPLMALMTMVQRNSPYATMQLSFENGSFSVWDSLDNSHSTSVAPMATGQWLCLEWQVHYNYTTGSTRVWLDGQQILSGNGLITDPDPFYYYLRIGLEATTATATDVWVDELVADEQPIGCTR
jgi:hypothetical protein